MMEYEGFVRYEAQDEEWKFASEGWYWHPSERETFGPFEDEESAEAFAKQWPSE